MLVLADCLKMTYVYLFSKPMQLDIYQVLPFELSLTFIMSCNRDLIAFHLTGGFIVIILRIPLIILSIILCGPRTCKSHITIMKYALNPVGKRLTYIAENGETNSPLCNTTEHFNIAITMFVMLAVGIIQLIFAGLYALLTMNKGPNYHLYCCYPLFMMYEVVIVDAEEFEKRNERAIANGNPVAITNANTSKTDEEAPPEYTPAKQTAEHAQMQISEGHGDGEEGATFKGDEIRTWLVSIQMDIYYDTFIENGFDSMDILKETKIEDGDLEKIGIDKMGHRKKLEVEIEKLKSGNGVTNQ